MTIVFDTNGEITPEELRLRGTVAIAEASMSRLGADAPALTSALAGLVAVIAQEASRSPGFAKALGAALATGNGEGVSAAVPQSRKTPAPRAGKRAAGMFDPFDIFEEEGACGLRGRLTTIDVEQLKDIIAEHGMNYDKAAMRWKNSDRLIERIVERVDTRSTKGDAFR